MELHDWLDEPNGKGRTTWLADQLGVTKGAVSQWRSEGVPMKHMERIAQLVGCVTVDEMFRHALASKREAPAVQRAAA